MKKILFWGIGGASMSALAMLTSKQYEVWGYDDFYYSPTITHKIKIAKSITPEFLKSFDEIVYTSAVSNSSQLVKFAKKNSIPIFERAEFLGNFSKTYSNVIAISGTHGKTTTTAMIGEIFRVANLNPTVHVGGIINDWQTNYLLGEKQYFITEACEYNKSFLHLSPTTTIITNIEAEHLDTYHTFENEKQAFIQFASQSQNVFAHEDIDYLPSALSYGFGKNNYVQATDITEKNGMFSFTCLINGKNVGKIDLKILGKHNILNALASIAVANFYDIEFSIIKQALENFSGVYRRMTKIKSNKLGTHFLDYAHHPTEIKATLKSLNLLPHNKLIAIFQPHTYSRTLTLMKEFCSSFVCDELYLLPTYSARENFIAGGDALDLFYNLNGKVDCKYYVNPQSLYYDLDKCLDSGDIVAWLGAGDIDKICFQYTKK